ncbi:hypothetical protein ABFS82_04G030900 [Erythranthe guttata]|uniref:Bifunctional inhibitor/plant lipid transfer protein/seed storage helical domain-containing protein n=1 Tax=Erythranthe guttata TaxID=4155 RepID=A0A022S2H7_ERYGU|nr:PREDICTED: non-specific lipid-transfer protein-like protein At2g13820 [Erythranthe guttata]EYU46559.1 hypothetical protein MIMGU_mgv1a015908mg [Erythranthe guttata]|eukprot:XP_012832199.1 PREDICTED: non-specific lipid-transfer protein-like protein At2g13820 [Erythranthe guttata]
MEIIIIGLLSLIFSASLSSAVEEKLDCKSTISSLMPCYPSVTDASSAPSSQCCNQLKNVLETQPLCLCQILSESGFSSTRVLELPKACNLQTPPPSKCNSPPGPPGSNSTTPPPPAGYSSKITYSVLLAAASFAGVVIVII